MAYPRETEEPVLFNEVMINGQPTSDFEYQITGAIERPSLDPEDWSAPLQITDPDGVGTVPGFNLRAQDHGPGRHKVWVKVGTVIVEAGTIEID